MADQQTSETRPSSVRDLRKLFEGKGKAQTPSEYSSAARASAARHNLAVRMEQVKWEKRSKQVQQMSILEDPRRTLPSLLSKVRTNFSAVAGMRDSEITEFVTAAAANHTDRSRALADVLHADIQVGDKEIDNMSIRELRSFISDNNGDLTGCKRLADYRLSALQVKQLRKAATGLGEDEEYDFYIPQLTTALTSGSANDVDRAILQMFFEEYDPSRLREIDQLLEKFKGEEDELFADLAWKYPEHANKIVTFSISATYAESRMTTDPSLPAESPRRPSYIVSALRMM